MEKLFSSQNCPNLEQAAHELVSSMLLIEFEKMENKQIVVCIHEKESTHGPRIDPLCFQTTHINH